MDLDLEDEKQYQELHTEFAWAKVQPPHLPIDVKTELMAALRSGEYEQGFNALHEDKGYCCLGVRCDLLAKAGLGHWENLRQEIKYPRDTFETDVTRFVDDRPLNFDQNWDTKNSSILPESVQMKDGWETAAGLFASWSEYPLGRNPENFVENYELTSINDAGFTFSQIADVIDYFL